MPEIIDRRSWGYRYGLGWGFRALPATTAWLHHSVTTHLSAGASYSADREQMRVLDRIGYQRFNYADGGWTRPAGAGISYTYVVFPSGRIFQGHDARRKASHTSGHNTDGIGICLAGNYDNRPPTENQLDAVAWLLNDAVRRGELDTARLDGGHRDTGFATSCPGDLAHRAIPEINRRAAAGTTTPPTDEKEFDVSDAQYKELKGDLSEVLNVLNHHIRGDWSEDQLGDLGTSRQLPLRDVLALNGGRINTLRQRQWDVIKATDAVVETLEARGLTLDAQARADVAVALQEGAR